MEQEHVAGFWSGEAAGQRDADADASYRPHHLLVIDEIDQVIDGHSELCRAGAGSQRLGSNACFVTVALDDGVAKNFRDDRRTGIRHDLVFRARCAHATIPDDDDVLREAQRLAMIVCDEYGSGPEGAEQTG
jgi:hypothetical protein